jgi:hypothetical protein
VTRLSALVVLLDCATAGPQEEAHLRVVPLREGIEIAVRRGGEWRAVARASGAGLAPASVAARRALLSVTSAVSVEVPGRRAMALFPGLEFLEGNEPSSSDRDAHGPLSDRRRPDPWKVTVPLMAYEVEGALVMLMWKGDARPFFEAREKNLMSVTGSAVLLVEDGASIYDAVPRWTETFGLPEPEPWPRTMEEEIALCKEGFRTVSTPDGKHRHCVGWAPAHTPGFATLLHLAGEKVDWDRYPDLLSSANCHILRWEAPFHAGKPELARNLVEPMRALARRRVEAEWRFEPSDEKRAKLGKRGDAVVGTSAHNALLVAKAARMTGDGELRSAALETLEALRRHKVPRGAQAWECPLYEPDLLAAAYAVGAYVEAFKLSGEKRHLEEAVRWAKAGLPFLYLWRYPDKPLQLYASIPVFGTTHFTHSWFGVPVQWNGLVYAYYLRKLAPLDKGFDWRRVADGILASAVHQQYTEGPSKGCYPDAVYEKFTKRSPADINPENILINLLASIGKDPDPDLKLGR